MAPKRKSEPEPIVEAPSPPPASKQQTLMTHFIKPSAPIPKIPLRSSREEEKSRNAQKGDKLTRARDHTIRLLREDSDIQEILVDVMLATAKKCEESEIKTTVLRLLREDTEIRDAILGLIPKPHRKRETAKAALAADLADIPLDRRVIAFLRKHAKTSLTYEEFVEQIEVTYADLECILHRGFVDGFATLILRNWEMLDLSCRPMYSFSKDDTMVYIKTTSTRWKRDAASSRKDAGGRSPDACRLLAEERSSGVKEDNGGGGGGSFSGLREIVFYVSQKVDIKIAEFRDSPPVEVADEMSVDSWEDHLDCIRKQASGGIERIRLICDICRSLVDGIFVDI
jgi:hypothetical protein